MKGKQTMLKVFDKIEVIGHDDDQFGDDIINHIGVIQVINPTSVSTQRPFRAVIHWENDDFDTDMYLYNPADFKVIDSRVFNVGDKVMWMSCNVHYEHNDLKRKTVGEILEIHGSDKDSEGDCFMARIKWDGHNDAYDTCYNPYYLSHVGTILLNDIGKGTTVTSIEMPVKKFYSSEMNYTRTLWQMALDQEKENG